MNILYGMRYFLKTMKFTTDIIYNTLMKKFIYQIININEQQLWINRKNSLLLYNIIRLLHIFYIYLRRNHNNIISMLSFYATIYRLQ